MNARVAESMQTQSMNRLATWVVDGVRFIYAIKHIIAIVSLSVALAYLLAAETVQQRRAMVASFSTAQQEVTTAEAKVRTAGDAVFRNPSRTGALITQSEVDALMVAVRGLRSALVAAPAPNATIQTTRTAYVNSLTDLQGKLNLFEMGAEGTITVLTALDGIGVYADQYHTASARFLTSTFNSLLAAF